MFQMFNMNEEKPYVKSFRGCCFSANFTINVPTKFSMYSTDMRVECKFLHFFFQFKKSITTEISWYENPHEKVIYQQHTLPQIGSGRFWWKTTNMAVLPIFGTSRFVGISNHQTWAAPKLWGVHVEKIGKKGCFWPFLVWKSTKGTFCGSLL